MKRLFTIFATFAMLCAVGCEEQGGDDVTPNDKPGTEEPEEQKPENIFFGLDRESVSISPDGGSVDVVVYSNYKWEISGTSDWCTPSVTSGEANEDGQKVTFSADMTYDTREAIFWFRCADEKIKFVVSQNLKEVIIADENNTFSVSSEGGIVTIAYQTSIACEVIIPDDAKEWITFANADATRGLVAENINLNIAENTTYSARSAVIKVVKVGDNTLFAEYTINQVQNDAIIADENNTFNLKGWAQSINIAYKTNVECEVVIPEEAKSWISIVPATRALVYESATLNIAENNTGAERSAVVKVVKVGDNTLFAEYTINQVRQSDGVFVLCEGTFGAGNSSLWHYYPENKAVTANVFHSANDARLGDMAQSLYMYNGLLFVVVNNSGVVFAIDRTTGKVEGMIDDLLSPRFIAIDGTGTKGYISQMYTNELITFDPRTLERTGSITLEGVAGSEQMEVWGDKLFIASWSNDNKITVLDTDTDQQIATFEVGVQPYSMVLDKNDTLWVVCDGGNEYSTLPEGVTMEAPSLWKISAETNVKTKVFDFKDGGWFSSRLAINGAGDTIYFIYDKRCWAIDVATGKLPTESFITIEGYGLYGIGVDPVSEDIYIADAKDYVSNGEVFRYSPEGELIDTFEVGILPSSFAFFRE